MTLFLKLFYENFKVYVIKMTKNIFYNFVTNIISTLIIINKRFYVIVDTSIFFKIVLLKSNEKKGLLFNKKKY